MEKKSGKANAFRMPKLGTLRVKGFRNTDFRKTSFKALPEKYAIHRIAWVVSV